MNSFFTNLKGNTHGSVYVEALSILPVLVILWVGVVFTHQLDDAEQQSRLSARQCAWEYSEGNCENVPPSCHMDPEQGAPMEDTTEVKSKIENKDTGNASLGSAITSIIGELFGAPFSVKDTKNVQIPRMFGGKTAKKTGHQYLLCNEKEVDFLQKALQLGGKLAGDVW